MSEPTKQPIREAVVELAAVLCRLSDTAKHRAESEALKCLLATTDEEKLKKREDAMYNAGSHEAFRVAMNSCDVLRIRIENGEVI